MKKGMKMIPPSISNPFSIATQLMAYAENKPHVLAIGQGTQETKKQCHLEILRQLSSDIFIRQTEIAKQMKARASTTHERMAVLEKKGFVEQFRPSERRIMYRITAAGLQYLQTEDEKS